MDLSGTVKNTEEIEEKTVNPGDNKNISAHDTDKHENLKIIIPLAHTKQGKKYRIENINGGHCMNLRLNSLGIVPGDIVKVIYQGYGGPMTLAVKGAKIALGRGIAHKIEVSEQNF
ncbi:MAG: ferrous iron transport protein A [Actinobacteria bacterium]|nr:ferrous iron transport protein A [Actinomycetota bacterium]